MLSGANHDDIHEFPCENAERKEEKSIECGKINKCFLGPGKSVETESSLHKLMATFLTFVRVSA